MMFFSGFLFAQIRASQMKHALFHSAYGDVSEARRDNLSHRPTRLKNNCGGGLSPLHSVLQCRPSYVKRGKTITTNMTSTKY